MSGISKSVMLLINSIELEAANEEKALTDAVDKQKKQRLSDIKNSLNYEYKKRIREYREKNDIYLNGIISDKTYNTREKISKIRTETVKEVYELVRKKLEDFVQSEKYPDFLKRCINKAKQISCEECIVYISKADERYHEEIRQQINLTEIVVTEDILLGGLRFYFPGKAISVDLTLDCELEDAMEEFVRHNGFDF